MPVSISRLFFVLAFLFSSNSFAALLAEAMNLCTNKATFYSQQFASNTYVCEQHDSSNSILGQYITGSGLVYLKETNNTPDSTQYGQTVVTQLFSYVYYLCPDGYINYTSSSCTGHTLGVEPTPEASQLVTCPDCAKDGSVLITNQKLDTLNQTGQSIKQSTDSVTEKINSLTQGTKRNYGNYSMPTGSLDQSEPIAEIEAKKQEFTDLFESVKAQLSSLLTPTLNGVAALPTYNIGTFYGVPVSIDFQEYHQIFDYFGTALLTIGAFLALVIILG